MRKGVNGQAKIISTVLIMLIVIVAVVVIYNVTMIVVSEKGSDVGFGLKNYLQQLQSPNCGDGYCNLSEESCESCVTDCGECGSGEGGSAVEIPLTVTRDISSLGNGQYQIDLGVDVDETKNLTAYIIEETLSLGYGVLSSNYESARKINSPSWLAVADDSLTGLDVEDTIISYIVGLLVPDLVVNGDFYGSAVGWDGVLTNWHYGTLEIAFYSDSGSNVENISQDIGVIAGHSYQVNYSLFVTECSGNNELRVTLGDQIVHTHDCADLIGSHTYIINATNNGDLVFQADNSFGGGSDVLDFALDDVSVREVNSNPSPLEVSGIVITNNSQGNISGETTFTVIPGDPEPSIFVYSCQELNESGKTYVLQNPVSSTGTCFNIVADNIILDGNGFTIGGDQSPNNYGVHASGRNNLIIKNFASITDFYHGIDLISISGSVIQNITANSNSYGISLMYSSSNTLTSMTLNSNVYYGVHLYDSSDNIFSLITANSNTEQGIWLRNSNNNQLSDITANSNSYHGILLSGSNNNNIVLSQACDNLFKDLACSSSTGNSGTGNEFGSEKITACSNGWPVLDTDYQECGSV